MKTKTFLMAAVAFLVFSAAAFPQATYNVSCIPVTSVVDSGLTEKTGDITFTTVGEELTVTGTIVIEYGVPLTVTVATTRIVPIDPLPADTLYLPTFSWEYVGATPEPGTVKPYSIVIKIYPYAGSPADTATDYSFRLGGVRFSAAGDPYATPLFVNITSFGNLVGNLFGPGDLSAVKVNNGQHHGLESLSSDDLIEFNSKTGRRLGWDDDVTLTVTEGFRSAFALPYSSENMNGPIDLIQMIRIGPIGQSQMIKILLSDKGSSDEAAANAFALPAGLSLVFPARSTDGKWVRATEHGVILDTPVTVDSTYVSPHTNKPSIYYRVMSDTDVTEVENVYFHLTDIDADELDASYPDIIIYAYASLAAIEAEANSTYIPRYVQELVSTSGAEIVAFVPSTTTLMIPYATTLVGYNTGIAIANTTIDPGEDIMNFSGAVPQDGKIVFYFYPTGDGGDDWFSLSTEDPDIPNQDLLGDSARGIPNYKLANGNSYVSLLSQLLEVAGHSGDFSGYVIAVCDFTNAHGAYYLSNFDGFTSGSQMLVLDSRIPYIHINDRGRRIRVWYESSGRREGTEGADH
jgi:hypothetical protein